MKVANCALCCSSSPVSSAGCVEVREREDGSGPDRRAIGGEAVQAPEKCKLLCWAMEAGQPSPHLQPNAITRTRSPDILELRVNSFLLPQLTDGLPRLATRPNHFASGCRPGRRSIDDVACHGPGQDNVNLARGPRSAPSGLSGSVLARTARRGFKGRKDAAK